MNSTRRNVGLLAACQALLLSINATLIAIAWFGLKQRLRAA